MAKKQAVPKSQIFRFTASDAMSVLLVGNFTHWQSEAIPMRKGLDGVWTASVNLPPGTHTYRFIVDGEWRDDPECTIHVQNPYGGKDMVRRVG